MKQRIDLHIHTTISDGTFSPFEVIDEAKLNDISVISIADHDTIDEYTEEFYHYARSNKIKIINGVEISTKSHGVGIHVLGYNIDIKSEELKNSLYRLRNIRHKYLHDVGTKLEKIGYRLNIDKLDKIDTVTKAHIAINIINDLKNKELLLKEFNHIPKKGEFIESIMNEGCKAYVEKDYITPLDAANIIRKAGGKVVLAHPVAYIHQDGLTKQDILEIIKFGLRTDNYAISKEEFKKNSHNLAESEVDEYNFSYLSKEELDKSTGYLDNFGGTYTDDILGNLANNLEGQTVTEKAIDFINRIKKVKTIGRPTDMDYVQIINWILSKSKDKEFAERIDVSSFVYEHTKELPRRVLFKILEQSGNESNNKQEKYRYIEFDYKTKMFDEIDEKTIVEKLEREISL